MSSAEASSVQAGEHRRLVLGLLDAAGPSDGPGVEGFLGRAVAAASSLVGARYAAIGVVDAGAGLRVDLVVHTDGAGGAATVHAPPAAWGLEALLRPAHAGAATLPGAPDPRTLLVLPIPSEASPLGFLCLADTERPGDFAPEDVATASALAATVGLRIEQERQCDLHRRRAEWLAASLRITSDLVVSESPEQALRHVGDLARDVSGADAVWIRAGGAREDVTLVVISRDPAAGGVAGAAEPDPDDDLLTVVVPMRSPDGVHGSLTMAWAGHRRAEYEAVPRELPAGFAEQAVLALEVARSREERARLQVLEERERIARDLHDVALQDLFASALELQALARSSTEPQARRGLELAASELLVTSRNIRRSIFGLGMRDPGRDLHAEVERLVQRAGATLKLDVDLDVRGPLAALEPDVGADLLAVLSEALSNATRHSGAGAVDVRIDVGRTARLCVTDDGVGIPADATPSGLENMRQRAERHGGWLVVGQRLTGGGTRVVWATGAGAGAVEGRRGQG